MEDRLSKLEAREEIKETIARYCYAVDKPDFDDLMGLFHEKAVLVVDPWGDFEGHPAIRGFYQGVFEKGLSKTRHLLHNQLIKVEGSQAHVTSYFDATAEAGGKSIVGGGYYEHQLAKEGNAWKIMRKKIKIDFLIPLEEGWAKEKKILSL